MRPSEWSNLGKYLLLNGWSHTQHGSLKIRIPMRRSSSLFLFLFIFVFVGFLKQKAVFMAALFFLSISQFNRESNVEQWNRSETVVYYRKKEWINEQTTKSTLRICVCECDPSIFNKKFQLQRIIIIKKNHNEISISRLKTVIIGIFSSSTILIKAIDVWGTEERRWGQPIVPQWFKV